MINHSTVKERRRDFDRPKPTRIAKKSSIRRSSKELRTTVSGRKARSHPAVIACLPLLRMRQRKKRVMHLSWAAGTNRLVEEGEGGYEPFPVVVPGLPIHPLPLFRVPKSPPALSPHQAASIAKCSATKQALANTTDAEVGKPKVAKEVGGRKSLDNCIHEGTLVF
ncbi:hypothetical protein Tco_1349671 [Tanacetum coccineum]